ncbi:hypothetical protein LCGC14_1859630, partial [marine sediment metagenome]
MWVQHMLATLNNLGRLGVVLDNGALFRGQSEGNFVLYIQSTSRGHESVKDILEGFEEQQKCLGHLLSDIIELIVKLEKENER